MCGTRIFEAPSKAEAGKRMQALQAGLGKQVPEAMTCLENGFEAATHFYAFPGRFSLDQALNVALERGPKLVGEMGSRWTLMGPSRAPARYTGPRFSSSGGGLKPQCQLRWGHR